MGDQNTTEQDPEWIQSVIKATLIKGHPQFFVSLFVFLLRRNVGLIPEPSILDFNSLFF